MEMKFKFDNGKTITLGVFDTVLNQKILKVAEDCRNSNVAMYQRVLCREIGRKDGFIGGDKDTALTMIKQGFKLTGITPIVSLDSLLTIQDCNVIHRQFTNAFSEHKYNVKDLQMINHGVHNYESTLATPNYCSITDNNVLPDQMFGYDIYVNMAEYTMDILDEDKLNLPKNADVYLSDECRIGRSMADAWGQGDDPSNWDIRDIDRTGPLFVFQNSIRKKLYSSNSFHKWLLDYNSTEKKYADIPFANIINGKYEDTIDAKLLEILW